MPSECKPVTTGWNELWCYRNRERKTEEWLVTGVLFAASTGHVVVPAGSLLPASGSGRLDSSILRLRLHHSCCAETCGPPVAVHQVSPREGCWALQRLLNVPWSSTIKVFAIQGRLPPDPPAMLGYLRLRAACPACCAHRRSKVANWRMLLINFDLCCSDTGTMAPERCVFGIMLDVSCFLGNICHFFVTNVALTS